MPTSTPPDAAHRHARFEHVALFHDGHDELMDLVTPCVTDALERGDAVLVCGSDRFRTHLEATFGDDASELDFVPEAVRYTKPAVAMRTLHAFARDRIDAGA